MSRIRIAIAGVGNCASSLVQGLSYYAQNPTAPGLMHATLGGYEAKDIEIAAAFDVDVRKVGTPLDEAIFAQPNNTKVFCRPARSGPPVIVQMSPILDGIPDHMSGYPDHQRFIAASEKPIDTAGRLRDSRTQILVNYLPVGAQKATEHFAQACLDAGVAMVNCIPVFIASNPAWAERFRQRQLPIVGDDIKAQVGATITHRTLVKLLAGRGVRVDRPYQLNTGGDTDFLHMLHPARLKDKKVSKTEAVTSQLGAPVDPDNVHIGPSDFVPWLADNKVCFLRVEGTGFGGVPMNIELRLSVEDSPNSAAVVVDAIRLAKVALDRKQSGPIEPASAWCMKHPPRQMTDAEAKAAVEGLA